jgi:hypothetical protein
LSRKPAGSYPLPPDCQYLYSWIGVFLFSGELPCKSGHDGPSRLRRHQIISVVADIIQGQLYGQPVLHNFFSHGSIPQHITFYKYIIWVDETIICLRSELLAFTRIAINPLTGLPYEHTSSAALAKYSFISTGNTTGAIGAVNLEGNGNDFGIGIAQINNGPAYISYVEQGSPADAAGLTRGDLAYDINGTKVANNTAIITNALDQPSLTMTVRTPAGDTLTAPLTKKAYTSSAVYKSKVVHIAGKTIGYISLARFSSLATTKAALDGIARQFAEAGATDLHVVGLVFITSANTASASELVINALKPYYPDEKLIGATTYGKPVGFFGISIHQQRYTVYMSQFHILNADGEGDYYEGIKAHLPAADDVTHDFGDTAETCFSHAFSILSGKTPPALQQMVVMPLRQQEKLNGMIGHPIRLRR